MPHRGTRASFFPLKSPMLVKSAGQSLDSHSVVQQGLVSGILTHTTLCFANINMLIKRYCPVFKQSNTSLHPASKNPLGGLIPPEQNQK